MNKVKSDKIAVLLGGILLWYAYTVCNYFIDSISKAYFPNFQEPFPGFINFATWESGFFFIFLGSLLFGRIGDLQGRAKVFKLTSKLIFIPTVILPFIPTYEQIGVLSIIILILCRAFQAVILGAEFPGIRIYLYETSSNDSKYFSGCLPVVIGSFGVACASFVSYVLTKYFSDEFIDSIGYRLAFALEIIFAVVVYILRKNISETKEYKDFCDKREKVKQEDKLSKIRVLQLMILTFAYANTFYFVYHFISIYEVYFLQIPRAQIVPYNIELIIIYALLVPLVGYIADRIGSKKLLLYISALSFITFAIPLEAPLEYPFFSFWFVIVFLLLTILKGGIIPSLNIYLLPVYKRYFVCSCIHNLIWGIFRFSVPILNFYVDSNVLLRTTYIYYIIFTTVISLIVIWSLKKEDLL